MVIDPKYCSEEVLSDWMLRERQINRNYHGICSLFWSVWSSQFHLPYSMYSMWSDCGTITAVSAPSLTLSPIDKALKCKRPRVAAVPGAGWLVWVALPLIGPFSHFDRSKVILGKGRGVSERMIKISKEDPSSGNRMRQDVTGGRLPGIKYHFRLDIVCLMIYK